MVVVVAILLAFITFTLRQHARFYDKWAEVRFERALISEAYPRMKTGDLILFSAAGHDCVMGGLGINELFTHAAVIVNKEDPGGVVKPYISETMGDGCYLLREVEKRTGKGGFQMPLLARLKDYPGNLFYMELDRALDAATEGAIRRAADRSLGHPYPSKLGLFLNFLGFRESAGRRGHSRHCFSHVAAILNGVGLHPRGAPISGVGSDIARAIPRLFRDELENPARYRRPVSLLYDVDAHRCASCAPPMVLESRWSC